MRMLSHRFILDLTDEKGPLCGKILADLGGKVVKVERPGGDTARGIPPYIRFAQGKAGAAWLAFNQGKKGVTLNLQTPEGKELFKALAASADLVIESFAPGQLSAMGLGFDELHRLNPRLVLVSITPFGQSGPYRQYKGDDLVVTAMSGYLYLCGDSDRPPVRVSFPLAYSLASSEAAVGALMALYRRRATGGGQHVDVSAQQAMARMVFSAFHFWYLEERLIKRGGPLRAEISGALKQRQIWRCRDGWISFALYGGQFGARNNKPLAAWMEQEGFADDFLRGVDWDKLDMSSVSPKYVQELEERIARFFETRTKEQLLVGAIGRKIILLPLLGIDEAFRSPHLEARGFWAPIDHGETGRAIHYPAFFCKSSLGSFGPGSRPPLPGEHNAEIYGRIGLSPAELSDYQRRGVI